MFVYIIESLAVDFQARQLANGLMLIPTTSGHDAGCPGRLLAPKAA